MRSLYLTTGAAFFALRLNSEIVRLLNQPETKERLLNTGMETTGSSPEGFAAAMKAEIGRLGKVIKEAGIRDE